MRSRQFFALNTSAMTASSLFPVAPPTYPPEWREDAPLTATATTRLLRIQLDDQLLLDRHGEVLAVGDALHRALHRLLVQLDPLGHAAPIHRLQRLGDADHLPALLGDLDDRPRLHLEGRDVH